MEGSQRPKRRSGWPIPLPNTWGAVRRSNSILYDSIIPIALILMAIFTIGLILFTFGILVGIIPYQ